MILTCSSEVKIYHFFFLFNFPKVLSTAAEILKILDTALSKFALISDRAESEYRLRIK